MGSTSGVTELPNSRLRHLTQALEFELTLIRETEVHLALSESDERTPFGVVQLVQLDDGGLLGRVKPILS